MSQHADQAARDSVQLNDCRCRGKLIMSQEENCLAAELAEAAAKARAVQESTERNCVVNGPEKAPGTVRGIAKAGANGFSVIWQLFHTR